MPISRNILVPPLRYPRNTPRLLSFLCFASHPPSAGSSDGKMLGLRMKCEGIGARARHSCRCVRRWRLGHSPCRSRWRWEDRSSGRWFRHMSPQTDPQGGASEQAGLVPLSETPGIVQRPKRWPESTVPLRSLRLAQLLVTSLFFKTVGCSYLEWVFIRASVSFASAIRAAADTFAIASSPE